METLILFILVLAAVPGRAGGDFARPVVDPHHRLLLQ